MGVTKLFLCGYTGCPPRKEISKTALGAEEAVPWEHCQQTGRLIKRLQAEGVCVIALEQTTTATPLNQYTLTRPTAIILGNEVTGVTPAVLKQVDTTVEIPMLGSKESLNVAVAGGIALYTLRQLTPQLKRD